MVTDFHECFTLQIKPPDSEVSKKDFYNGAVYSGTYITRSIENGKLESIQKYLLGSLDSDDCRKLGLTSKKKITIMEGMKMFEIATQSTSDKYNKQSFWNKLAGTILPERGADTLLKFWKINSSKTLEEFLIQSIFDKVPFSLSCKEIPCKENLESFKKRNENAFARLEAL